MAWQNPKLDWTTNPKSPMAVDFNRIEGNIKAIYDEIGPGTLNIYNALDNIGATPAYQSFSALVNAINAYTGKRFKVFNDSVSITNGLVRNYTGIEFVPSQVIVFGYAWVSERNSSSASEGNGMGGFYIGKGSIFEQSWGSVRGRTSFGAYDDSNQMFWTRIGITNASFGANSSLTFSLGFSKGDYVEGTINGGAQLQHVIFVE